MSTLTLRVPVSHPTLCLRPRACILMHSGSNSQVQVVCVPPSPTHGPPPDFLLKPAPSAAKYRNKRRLLQHVSPPPSSTLRHQSTPPSSFLQFFDTPSPIPKSASAFSLSSAIPSPPIDRPKRHARAFDKLPFTFAHSPSFPPTTAQVDVQDDPSSVYSDHDPIEEEPRYSSEGTLYDPANEEPSTQAKDPEQRLQEDSEHFTFLHSDPYASALILKYPSSHSQAPQTSPLSAWTSFLHRSPPPPSSSPRTRTSRNRSLSSASFSALKPKNPFKSIPNPFKNITIMPSSSSSSSNRPSSSRKAPEKVLPFTTQQIAELDRLMGNSKAAKGKVASQYAPGTHSSSSEKHYIAPYVPLNGSAPSGTRSFGRDGEHHPIGASTGMSKREVGVQGESIPYLRDENGVMWSGQEEMDEYQQLLDQAEARRRRKAAISHIDTRRSSEDSWKQFDPTASSVDSSSSSVLRSAGSGDVFDLGYDEAVMIPEGGAIKLSAVSTVGGLTKVSGPVTLGPSTRGVESFPAPQPTSTSNTKSGSSTPRPKGADRRIRPGTVPQPPSDPVDGRAAASQTSLGTIRPTLPLDQEGKMEFFGDAFAPPPAPAPQRSALPPLQPIQPSATWGQQAQPSPGFTPKSKLHRHSTSLAVGSANFFQNLVNAHSKGNDLPASPLSPTSPSYLAPLPHPDKYSGLRQASFSGPGGFAAKGSLRSPTFAPPPVPALPPKYVAENLKTVKKKSSGMGVAQMFKKLTKV